MDGAVADRLTPDRSYGRPASIPWTTGIEPGEWDGFVAKAPGGRHVQTSAWADLKTAEGWKPVRIGVRSGSGLTAGAQLLFRSVPFFGRVGYVPHGPVVLDPDTGPVEQVVWGLMQTTTDLSIRHLTVQPPPPGLATERVLESHGFFPGTPVAPSATVLVDLDSESEILGRMSSRTRYNARLGERRDLTFSEGGHTDLPLFHDLLRSTASRQGFEAPSLEHFRRMWDVLGAPDGVRLFLVHKDEEPVSAMLAVVFAGTVTNKLAVWSGAHGRDRPNEFLHWRVMQWALASGHQVYDFEGIPREAAVTALGGDPLPEKHRNSVASFKLGFGGRLVLGPQAWSWSPNRTLGMLYRFATSSKRGQKAAKRILNRLRIEDRP